MTLQDLLDLEVPSVILFDVDHTLECSSGPVPHSDLRALKEKGHIVGICGNWAQFVNSEPAWHQLVSILGSFNMTKPDFMRMVRQVVPAQHYVMVGNDEPGKSEDGIAAREAEWWFVKEDELVGSVLLT